MSKTRLNQIAPGDLVATFGSDGVRYHFLRDQNFGPDGDFSYEAMVARYNADLANNFGNLASRVLNMAVNYLGGVYPAERENGPLRDQSVAALEGLSRAPTVHTLHVSPYDEQARLWSLFPDARVTALSAAAVRVLSTGTVTPLRSTSAPWYGTPRSRYTGTRPIRVPTGKPTGKTACPPTNTPASRATSISRSSSRSATSR